MNYVLADPHKAGTATRENDFAAAHRLPGLGSISTRFDRFGSES